MTTSAPVLLDWSLLPCLHRDPEIHSGDWVFVGTRVPVTAILNNLELGLDGLLDAYPTPGLANIKAVLNFIASNAS